VLLGLTVETMTPLDGLRTRTLHFPPPAPPPPVSRNRYSDAAQALAERLVRDVPLAGRAVLDVGCGNGDAALLYAKSFGALDVLGVNISVCHGVRPHGGGEAVDVRDSES
jgi:hypothetical protein